MKFTWKTIVRAAAALAIFTVPSVGVAQKTPLTDTVAEAGDPTEILVTASAPLTLLSRQELADLRKTYLKLAPSLAPAASVKMRPSGPSVTQRRAYAIDEVTGESTELVFEPDGTIPLPSDGEDGRHSVQLSSGHGARGVRIQVFSPGTNPEQRRIGDLRLECKLWWSVARRRSSFLMRAAAGKSGPCDSKRFGYAVRIGREIASATVSSPDGLTQKSPLSRDKLSAWAPLWNGAIADEATLSLK